MIKSKFQMEFEGCSLPRPALCKTENLTSALVFCMDCVFEQLGTANTKKHCDEVVFSDDTEATRVYCIENKEGTPRVSLVLQQLQNGADVVSAHLSGNEAIRFFPVLATTTGVDITPSQRQQMKVKCGGIRKPLRVLNVKNNAKLSSL